MLSSVQKVKSGVPQGSVLGPILFLIYINDIGQHIQEDQLLIFADDTTIINKNKSISVLEQESFVAVNLVGQYFSETGLKINSTITNFVHFQTLQAKSRRQVSPSILFNEDILTEVDVVKYLGANIDSCFQWKSEVNEVANKISKGLFVLRGFTHLENLQLSKVIYFSLIECHIRYSIILWGSSSKINLEKIFIYQKRAIRSIARVPRLTPCREIFKKLNILTVPSIYIFESVYYAKSQNLINSHNHQHLTRNRHINSSVSHRLKLTETSPEYYGQKFYHTLPEELKSINNLQRFKNSLQKYLVDKCYYELPNLVSKPNPRFTRNPPSLNS